MDFERIAREFLVSLRGKRSQVAWSRRLGYRSNVAYAWEAGRRWPTAAESLRAAHRAHVDVGSSMKRFYGTVACPWADAEEPWSPESVAQLLEDVRGNTSITELARRADLSRYSVSRWLTAQTQPRLPDFFRLLEAASLRLVDFLAEFVDPLQMPSIADIWRRLEARREGAAEHPWTQAIIRAFELEAYLALPEHEEGWVARRLGIDLAEEQRAMAFLELTEQLEWDGRHYRSRAQAVDTRRNPSVGMRLKEHWSTVGTDRIRAEAPGQYSYNVFAISNEDFERIREAHLEYFGRVRSIVGASKRGERVAIVNIQLFALDS